MKDLRAIICDVYETILDVREAPVDAEDRWQRPLWRRIRRAPTLPSKELESECRAIISEIMRGSPAWHRLPEVHWPSVMKRALPALDALP